MKQPPKPDSHKGGRYMSYGVSLFCAGGRTVQVHQKFWEYDFGANPNDNVGEHMYSSYRYHGTKSKNFDTTIATPNTEPGAEELYQGVRFRVKLLNNAWSDWSPWEYSPYVTVKQP
jgi:hypothetical protein